MEQPPASLREVSLEEAMSIAILFQKSGQLAEADDLYRKILEIAPDDPDALHYAGVLAHQQGASERAAALIEQSIAIDPHQPDRHNNLGIVLRALGRLDEAADAYRRAIALEPAHANAHSNLGVLLKAQGHLEEAEASYRAAIGLNPEHVDAHHNLGVLLSGRGRTQEAVACFCRVTTLSPKHTEARTLLVLAHCTLGERDKATRICEQWLLDEPDNPVARHLLAACSGRDVPARASDSYVEKTFDGFAATFDAKLAKLSYRAPTLIAAMLADSGVEPNQTLDVLDAGCGTGLCGLLVAPFARRLAGVDLSGAMLARAAERRVYDDLVKQELTAYLSERPASFDLIVSADTLVYFGPLEDVLAAVRAALRPGGSFLFTLEKATETEPASPWSLRVHGRYSHLREYVAQVLAGLAFHAHIVEAELRMESGCPVAGLVICASLAAAAGPAASAPAADEAPAAATPGGTCG